jgi:hypothetical protein
MINGELYFLDFLVSICKYLKLNWEEMADIAYFAMPLV